MFLKQSSNAAMFWFNEQITLNSRKDQRTNQKYRNLVGSDQQMQRLEEIAPRKGTLKTSASEPLYGGQFTLSTQLIKPNYLVLLLPTQHHSFFRYLPPELRKADRTVEASGLTDIIFSNISEMCL